MAKPREDRLEDLLTAAMTTFRRVGLDATTVADITDEAGVAKGTFYLYFESRDHVLGAIWDRYLGGLVDEAARLFADPVADQDWLALLDGILENLIRHAVANAELHRMIYQSANARALELCRQTNERVIAVLIDGVRQARNAGQVSVLAPEVATRFIYHGLHGLLADLIAREAVSGRPIDADELVAIAREFSHRLLGVAP